VKEKSPWREEGLCREAEPISPSRPSHHDKRRGSLGSHAATALLRISPGEFAVLQPGQ
jgi:hypothetical protein